MISAAPCSPISLIRLAFFFALIRLRFEAFDFLEFSGGFLLTSQLLKRARQQITSLRIVRLLARSLLQSANSLRRPPLFEKDASRQLQRLDRLRAPNERRFNAAAGGVEVVLFFRQRS